MQRLVHSGCDLQDSGEINGLGDVQLIMSAPSRRELAESLVSVGRTGNVREARLLLEAGAELNSTDSNGCSSLFLACGMGHIDVARILLAAGADKDLQGDNRGTTPLISACEGGHIEVVRILLESAVDINMSDDWLHSTHECVRQRPD